MDLPDQIGVMMLPGATLFPQSMLPLFIFEPRYRRMLVDSLESHRMFCVAMRRTGCAREIPEPVAGLGLVRASVGHQDGTSHLVLQGLARVRLGKAVRYKPYRIHQIESLPTTGRRDGVVQRHLLQVKELVARRLELGLKLPSSNPDSPGNKQDLLIKAKDIMRYLEALSDPGQLADMVACSLLQEAAHRQVILETPDLETRLEHLARCLRREMDGLLEGGSGD